MELASVTAAALSRAENIQRNELIDKRIDDQATTQTRTDELIRRKLTAEYEAQRKQGDILRRRDDLEAEIDKRRLLRGQRDVNDSIDSDNRLSVLRDTLTEELNVARADREAIEFLIESEFFEAEALDAPAGPEISQLLAERDERIAERNTQVRDDSIQQRIDLRLADDRIRELSGTSPGTGTERGSIVDVQG